MRKLLAVIIASVMILCAFAALAEEAVVVNASVITDAEQQLLFGQNAEIGSTMYTTVVPPAGYTAYSLSDDPDALFVQFVADDKDVCIEYDLRVAYSELLGDYTLNDLTEEEYANMVEILTADYNDAEVGMATTEVGTKLIIVNENGAESDYCDIITVYHGYFITVSIFDEDHQLNEAAVQAGVDILSSLTFTIEAPAAN